MYFNCSNISYGSDWGNPQKQYNTILDLDISGTIRIQLQIPGSSTNSYIFFQILLDDTTRAWESSYSTSAFTIDREFTVTSNLKIRIYNNNLSSGEVSFPYCNIIKQGGDIPRLLKPLSEIGRSTQRFIYDSYFYSFAIGGLINESSGSVVSVSGDTMTLNQSGGYAPGFIANCVPGRTYTLDINVIVGTSPSSTENHGLIILFFTYTATYISQIENNISAAQTRFITTFTPPTNATYTIIRPRRNENGNFQFSINSFTEN